LHKRGLTGVKLVISDAHEGLKAAITQVFKAPWQRCRVHFMRNCLAYVPKGQHNMVAAAIPHRLHSGGCRRRRRRLAACRRPAPPAFPKLAALMDDAETDVLAFMSFPRAHWPKLHSTNPLERLNKEVKRRANVVGIFPNEASVKRLVGAILLEQNDEWQLSAPLHDARDHDRPERRPIGKPAELRHQGSLTERADDYPRNPHTLTDVTKRLSIRPTSNRSADGLWRHALLTRYLLLELSDRPASAEPELSPRYCFESSQASFRASKDDHGVAPFRATDRTAVACVPSLTCASLGSCVASQPPPSAWIKLLLATRRFLQNRQRRLLVAERGGLRRDDVGIGDGSGGVLVEDETFGLPRGGDRGVLHLGLLLEDAERGERIFDLLEPMSHGLAVIGDVQVVECAGGVDLGAAQPRIEHRFAERRTERPDGVRGAKQRVERAAGDAVGRRQRHGRIVGRDGRADLRIRRGDAALSGGDVRPPLEQCRGQAGRITGTTRATGAGAIVNSAGGLPISTAMACSKAARWTPT